MEEPKKSGKSGKKRVAKAVIGTRERRAQGEPMMEGEAVMVVTVAGGTGCVGMAGAVGGAGQAVVGGRKRERARGKCRGGCKRARLSLDLRRVRPGKDDAKEAWLTMRRR